MCYNDTMPTKQWMEKRQLITFWLLKDEYRRFREACEREQKGQSAVLRETVLVMIDHRPIPRFKGQGRDA